MKKIALVVVAFIAVLTTSAQEKVMKPNYFGDNWFIQLQGGASATLSENWKDASAGSLLSPHVAVSVGKYFAPQVGARLQFGGWQSRSMAHLNPDVKTKFNYMQVNGDALFNLTNIFLPYKEDRVLNFIGILGVGYVHGFKKASDNVPTTNSIIPRVGLQVDFRMNDRINLNLEATGNLMHDDFNGIVFDKKYDATANLLAGITFKLGKNGFDFVDYVDPSQLEALNAQINAQRTSLGSKDREIAELKSALAAKPKIVIEKETVPVQYEETVMNAVVVFKLGKSDLQDNQEINIYNAAKFFQDNPSMNIIVTGYADKATGNPTINQKLSERRADAVAKILIEKYGISPIRITTQASGDKEQPFQIDAWNRVVIFTAVPAKK